MSVDIGLIIIAAIGALEGAAALPWRGMAYCFRRAENRCRHPGEGITPANGSPAIIRFYGDRT
jgi:hypothetical protein